jgi:hypothetical protein
MRKLDLTQLIKNTGAFTLISASAVNAGLLFADRAGLLNVRSEWYLNAPLGVWALVGIPVTINLASRIVHQVNPQPRRITGFSEGASPVIRKIPFNTQGKSSTLLAYAVPSIFGESIPEQHEYRPAIWHVPVEGNDVTVRESELRSFLEVCHRRQKYQFSRKYWTRRRRPPLYRPKYEAYMRLLTEVGLIEGRHGHGGASGYLITTPRYAITYLKHESKHRI